jgi:hypothetical protein|tara:strand:- start:35 stop:202 length:168 start_codon:yes stop_codon:yes gene_type:complete
MDGVVVLESAFHLELGTTLPALLQGLCGELSRCIDPALVLQGSGDPIHTFHLVAY